MPGGGWKACCAGGCERLHAALREAESRRSELQLLKKDFKERERLYAFLLLPAGETVLLAEDNEAVRRQTVSMLRSHGLRSTGAGIPQRMRSSLVQRLPEKVIGLEA